MKIRRPSILFSAVFAIGFSLLLVPSRTKAFSILAHEAVIDAEWENNLKPALLARYPTATLEELKTAHAYAYGGCLVPDMGYMPFGDPYFTDLLHYVRTGDFVMTLINDSQNLNQYAFALGVLSHYLADEYGHSLATNKTVPILYPGLEHKYGQVVTYADDHASHSRTEFAYDVLQTAKGEYATTAYHDFIGFSIDSALLATAFYKTYGESLSTVFPDYSSSVATFRWGVRDMFPELIHKAWRWKKPEIKSAGKTKRRDFRYRMPKRMFNKEFGNDYKKPDFMARLVVFMIKILPKVGPLSKLQYKSPGPEGEKLFAASMDSILNHYTIDLRLVNNNNLHLDNIDYDTGNPIAVYEYQLADETYKEWLISLQKQKFANATPKIRNNITTFYSKADTTILAKKDPDLLKALKQLQITAMAAASR